MVRNFVRTILVISASQLIFERVDKKGTMESHEVAHLTVAYLGLVP